MKKALKKGGIEQRVFEGAEHGDTFVLPSGFLITSIVTSKNEAGATALSVGTTQGVSEVQSFTVTHAASATTSLTIAGVTVDVVSGDAVGTVATKMATAINATPAADWTATVDTATVTVTNKNCGDKAEVTLVAGTSGVTIGAITTDVAGTQATTAVNVMNAVTLDSTGFAKQTVALPFGLATSSGYADQTMYINVSVKDIDFDVTVTMQKFN